MCYKAKSKLRFHNRLVDQDRLRSLINENEV